jgi:hypothetical protein
MTKFVRKVEIMGFFMLNKTDAMRFTDWNIDSNGHFY